jgi:hypothetical protein
MNETYNTNHSECMQYLYEIYIQFFKRKFVRCFINQVLNFNTIVTFREKEAHAVLKRNLELSTRDLKLVVDNIDLLLKNQRHDYLIAFEEAKMRFSLKFRIDLFRNLSTLMTSYALRLIFIEYKRLINHFTVISACTHSFTTVIDLSCSHKIQKRLYDSEHLLLEDVHSH